MQHLSRWPKKDEVFQALEEIKDAFLKNHPEYSGTGMYENERFKGMILMQDAGSFFDCSDTIKHIESLGLFWMVKKFSKGQDFGKGLDWDKRNPLAETDIVLDVYYPYYN